MTRQNPMRLGVFVMELEMNWGDKLDVAVGQVQVEGNCQRDQLVSQSSLDVVFQLVGVPAT